MKALKGFTAYMNENQHQSVFDRMCREKSLWHLHVHGHQVLPARGVENMTYEVKVETQDREEAVLKKTDIKCLYPGDASEGILKLLKKTDKAVKNMNLGPIETHKERNFIKNKSLFPLMLDRQVVFFTLLEGEIIRGIIGGFSRYEITVLLKGGTPLTLLRHSIQDLRDKNGRCYLKSVQEASRDWQKSTYYIEEQAG